MIVGTSAKDSLENAFAMLSNNGLTTWNRIDLTNISEYGIVNNIAVAFTYDDEPFVLYSVQKYTTSFAKENTDALSVTATRAEQIDGKYEAVLTNGDLSVTLDHELIDGTEQLTYNVTNLGFSSKGFHIYVKDADSKEIIEEKYFYLAAQKNAKGVIAAKNKLFSMDGHENVTILVERMNETDDEVTSDRKLTIRSLEEVYAQSTDGIVIPNNDATPQPEPAPAPTPNTPEKKNETPEKEETVEPEDAEKENETVPEKRGGGWKWIFGGAALCGILFFFLILFKRRKDEEEENQ